MAEDNNWLNYKSTQMNPNLAEFLKDAWTTWTYLLTQTLFCVLETDDQVFSQW